MKTLAKVAQAVGVPLWQLLMPYEMQIDRDFAGKLDVLVRAFLAADEEGRESLIRQAQREAKLGAIVSKLKE